MFFPISFFKKNPLAQRALSFFFVLCLVVGATVLSGCKTEEEDTGNLVGTWVNVAGENGEYVTTITITNSTVVYSGSYEGTVSNSPDFEASYGVLIIEFTKYADWGSEPSVTHDNVGKFGALYWKDLTTSSVSLADAYKKVNPEDPYASHTMFDTLVEAEAAFTNDAVGEYIDWSITSPYTK
jgi:hypothetical protein